MKLTEEQVEEIVKLYQEGMSLRVIAGRFSTRHENIYRILQRKEIEMRPRIEAVNKTLTIYTHDTTFFDVINTEEKAYWSGFVMADGNVYHEDDTDCYILSVGLKKIDECHIAKLKAALNSSHPIHLRKLAGLVIHSKKLCKALIKHGIVPRKSYEELLPPKMPNNLLRHFWRGYFDGDGSLHVTKNRSTKHGTSWGLNLLGSRTLLESFVDWTCSQELLSNRPTLHRTRPNSKTFEVKIRKKSEVYNVVKTLYEDSTVHLDRKMEKYLQLKKACSVNSTQLLLFNGTER